MSDGKIMLNGIVYGGGTEINDNAVANDATWSSSRIVSLLPVDTASGAVANFPDGADDVPIAEGVFNIVATQEGTGDPSPSNVRPINGFTGMTIHRADGENPHVIDTEYVVDWTTEAGTVYGGTLNATTGVLTVTFVRVDLGAIDWKILNTTNKFLYTQNQSLVPLAKPFSNNIRASAKCEIYPTLSRSEIKYSAPFETGLAIDQNGEMLISDQNSTWSTIQEAKAELSGHYVVYELATPVEITLTPEQINTLYGTNNIWADTGDATVEYRADVQKYIDKKIAEAVGGNRSLSLSKSAPEEVKEEKSEEKEEKTEEGGNDER